MTEQQQPPKACASHLQVERKGSFCRHPKVKNKTAHSTRLQNVCCPQAGLRETRPHPTSVPPQPSPPPGPMLERLRSGTSLGKVAGGALAPPHPKRLAEAIYEGRGQTEGSAICGPCTWAHSQERWASLGGSWLGHLLSMHGGTLSRTQWRDHKAGGQQLSQSLSIFRQTGLCQGNPSRVHAESLQYS